MKRRRVVLTMDVPTEGVAHDVWLGSLTSWLKSQGIGVQLSGDVPAAGVALSLSADATAGQPSDMTPARREQVRAWMGLTAPAGPMPLAKCTR